MMKLSSIAVTLLALALSIGTPRRAEACGGFSPVVIGIYSAGFGAYSAGYATDLALIVDDARMAAKHEHPTGSDAAVELGLTIPQLVAGLALVIAGSRSPYGYDWFLGGLGLGYVAVATPLIIHGLWAAATREATEVPRLAKRSRGTDFFVTPTVVSDGEHVGGGLAAVGRF